MKAKITVIIPTYNAEKYLIKSVNSVINQSFNFENIELIIVDDSSTDNTKTIIKDLSEKYENIIPFFLKENTGSPSTPRNIGIKLSSTDYIMFLDNDDFYHSKMCEKMYSAIKEYNVDVVICRYAKVINSRCEKPSSFLDKYDNIIIESINECSDLMTSDFPTMIWNKIFRKEVMIKNSIQFPEKELYEDTYFSTKFYLNAKGIVLLNDFFGYFYTIRKNNDKSTSHTFTKKNIIKQQEGLFKIFSLIKDMPQFKTLKNEMLVGWTKLFLLTDLNKEDRIILLKKIKPYYKAYKINTKLNVISLPFNILINMGIKIFAINSNFVIIVSMIYKFLNKIL